MKGRYHSYTQRVKEVAEVVGIYAVWNFSKLRTMKTFLIKKILKFGIIKKSLRMTQNAYKKELINLSYNFVN